MPASISIECLTGAGPSATVITQHRFNLGDTPTPNLNNPLRVPQAGYAYSWYANHRAKITGTYTEVSDFNVYGSGSIAGAWSLGAGGMVQVGIRLSGDNGVPDASYHQAAGQAGVSGYALDDAVNGHPYYNNGTLADVVNFDNYTANSPLLVDSGPYGPNAETHTKHWCLQAKYGPDAVQGDKPTQTVTLSWAEI